MAGHDDAIPDPVLETASAWALRLEASPDDAGLRIAFGAWMAESDAHARAWVLTQRAWRLTGSAPPVFAHEWPARRPAAGRAVRDLQPVRRRRVGLAAGLAMAAALLLVLAWPAIQLRLSADHATAVAETRRIPLDDGSVVTLAASSAMTVSTGATGREVTLLQGEAYFEVAPDRLRPFMVRSGDVTTTVTGTAFDVALTDRTVSVAVASGSVRVERVGAPPGSAAEIAGGQGVVVDRAAGTMSSTVQQADAVAPWRKGRLIVENALLADVVAALGRSHSGSIVIASAALRGKRVTGVYDLNDPTGALQVLAAPYGGVVRAFTPYLLVLSAD